MRIALTGGIACGKSSVTKLLEDRGAIIIDFDILAREAVAPGSGGLNEVVAAFGADVLLPDGSLDRSKLGEIVFNDAEARNTLNSIVHPEVRRLAMAREAVAPEDSIIIHVIPLLVESGAASAFDRIIVVDCSQRVQIKRLMARNDFTLAQAQARINAQSTRAERIALADDVINNDGSPISLINQVDNWWYRFTGEMPSIDAPQVLPELEEELTQVNDPGILLPIPIIRRFPWLSRKIMIPGILLGLITSIFMVILFQIYAGNWHYPKKYVIDAQKSGVSLLQLREDIRIIVPVGWGLQDVQSGNDKATMVNTAIKSDLSIELSTKEKELKCPDKMASLISGLTDLQEIKVENAKNIRKGFSQVTCQTIGKRLSNGELRGAYTLILQREADGFTAILRLSYNPAASNNFLESDLQKISDSLHTSFYKSK